MSAPAAPDPVFVPHLGSSPLERASTVPAETTKGEAIWQLDPTGTDLKRFLAQDPGGPVGMLNLPRFAERGRESYEEYGRRIEPFLEEAGATVVYGGDCSTALVAPPSHEWDAILVVRYPNRRAFSQMIANRKYQEITDLRTRALSQAVLQATIPWQGYAAMESDDR